MNHYVCQSVHSKQNFPHLCATLRIAWENKQPTHKQVLISVSAN